MRVLRDQPVRRLAALVAGRRSEAAFAALTDAGLVRAQNEDAWLARPEAGLFAVADGMGGHEHGGWASRTIVGTLERTPLGGDFDADREAAAEAIEQANGVIFDKAEALGQRIGSTVVALLLRADRYAVLWAGDSRAYRLREGRLVQLTTDHTRVQEKVALGQLSAERARRHPMAHVLTRAVGAEAEVALDGVSGAAEAGDVFLLCSDGLHGVVGDQEIERLLSREAPEKACRSLMELCRAGGAPDNVTLVTARA